VTEGKTPNWAGKSEDIDNFITTAVRESVRISQSGAGGKDIHVGVFDSAQSLADWQHQNHSGPIHCGCGHSFTSDDDEYHLHGRDVFHNISKYSPRAEVSLYQIINSDRNVETTALDGAITRAINDGVDIVNISGGDPWPGPVEFWPSTRHIKRLLEEQITVVAAAGNWRQSQEEQPPVHCPAAIDNVIAVGGHETYCPADPGDEDQSATSGPYYAFNDDCNYPSNPTNSVYCGRQGCVDGSICIKNQTEELWDRNPKPSNDKPDTFAPMHTVRENDEGVPFLEGGTSFAAPVVTASLANIYSEIRASGDGLPYPWETREAVRKASLSENPYQTDKYDAPMVRRKLGVPS